MKLKITLICLTLFFYALTNAQEKNLSDITSFKVRNSGTMMDKENNVDGYYFFYQVDKLKKGQREYAIRFLDNDLNEVATKSYIDSKNTYLGNSAFNNQAIAFAMVNPKEKQYKIITFDRKAQQLEDIVIPASKKEMTYLSLMSRDTDFNFLLPVDNKGFVFNYLKNNKKLGYALKYVPTDGNKAWEFASDPESKSIHTINPIQANEKVIVAIESTKKSMLSQTVNFKALILDINSGEVLFEKSFDREGNPRIITNAFLKEDGNLVLLGEYFEEGKNVLKAKSLGLFAETLDLTGNILQDTKVSWEDTIDKMMPLDRDGKKSKRGYVYFHDIVRTNEGSYYAIGERYKKTASAAGITNMVLSGGRSGNMTQLTITDAVFFKFDNNFELLDIEIFAKGKSRAPSVIDFGSPQLNANILKNYGAFDFEFVQIDPKKDRFYATYIDYERLKGEKNKSAFKAIAYSDGTLTEDKIYLENSKNRIRRRVFPAKLGNVMILEYNKKEKSMNIHLEKLNVN